MDATEAQRRLIVHGPNRLPRQAKRGVWVTYLLQFKSAFIYLLLAAMGVTLAFGEHADALFIFCVVQFNALIGTYQERRAQQQVEALSSVVPSWALVRRSGELWRIRTEDLVPGDLILVEGGVQVPADLRLCESRGLCVDEALVTGESVPVDKSATQTVSDAAPLAERPTMLFAGTAVTAGRGEGVVVATGAGTEVGRIAQALAEPGNTETPLMARMARFTRIVALTMVGVIFAIGAVEALRGMPLAEVFLIAVALAVAAIPEGLPVAMTIALSISVARMVRRNVVVRRLVAVEGLGACTLVASDKTGTLTCNELTARRLFVPGTGELSVSGEGYQIEGVISQAGREPDSEAIARAKQLARAGALASEARLRVHPDGNVTPLGDTVDAAFHVLHHKLLRAEERKLPELTSSIPYESVARFTASFFREGDELQVAVKGAFETVLEMCDHSEREAQEAATMMRSFAESGYRVLAVAQGAATEAKSEALGGLRFLGLVGLIDPLRPEAVAAVAECGKAGVAVRMITGDHPSTALAIAKELGIADAPEQIVVGDTLARLQTNQAAFDEAVDRGRVFARIEPLMKLTIVESLKRLGHYVAVTGDGVNDAPALRAAHIGAAMGRSGTDTARDAADLVLTDDNFASIVGGIEEGRVAYSNIRKVIYMLISTGSAEIALFIFSLAAGYPLPLTAVQLLWLNLVTQGAQHVGLAFERAEPGVLLQKPRPPAQGIFDAVMIRQTLLSGVWMGAVSFLAYRWLLSSDRTQVEASNIVLLLLVLFENAHVFNCRSETRSLLSTPFFSNRILLVGVIATQALHLVSMHLPGISGVLRVGPVGSTEWLAACAAALSVIVVMEVAKWAMRRRVGPTAL